MLPDMVSSRAVRAAQWAKGSLSSNQTRDAAWYALYALSIDEHCGLAWSMLARIILEVNQDPLATVVTRYALTLEIDSPERGQIERFHRIDLWSRGLLIHGEGTALLNVSDFNDETKLQTSPRVDAWFEEQLAPWGKEETAAAALKRMVAALADAWEMPGTSENPLHAEGWTLKREFEGWCADDPLAKDEPPTADVNEEDLPVLSDYWIEQEIAQAGMSGSFEYALDRARLWAELRPRRIPPLAALVRLLHLTELAEERDEVIEEIVSLESPNLNQLEEARVAFGECRLWGPQLEILEQMDALAPNHPVILANRGVALLEVGETDRGTADLERALEVDPNNGPALANLGLLRMRSNEYVAARKLLERAAEVAPAEAQVRIYLATCKNNQGDRAGAIVELKEALTLEPSNRQARELLEKLDGPQIVS